MDYNDPRREVAASLQSSGHSNVNHVTRDSSNIGRSTSRHARCTTRGHYGYGYWSNLAAAQAEFGPCGRHNGRRVFSSSTVSKDNGSDNGAWSSSVDDKKPPQTAGLGLFDMFGKRRVQIAGEKDVDNSTLEQDTELLHTVDDPVVAPADTVVTVSTDLDPSSPDNEITPPPPPNTYAGEVLKLKDLRIRRAPSPPRPMYQKIFIGVASAPGKSKLPDKKPPEETQPPAPKTASVKNKKKCGTCFRNLRLRDLQDARNKNLKRREKKCDDCWREITESKSRPSWFNKLKDTVDAPKRKTRPHQQHQQYPMVPMTLFPEIPPHLAAVRGAVAALLQDIAVSRSFISSETEEREQEVDGYWHVPFWMFDLPLLPPELRGLVDLSHPLPLSSSSVGLDSNTNYTPRSRFGRYNMNSRRSFN